MTCFVYKGKKLNESLVIENYPNNLFIPKIIIRDRTGDAGVSQRNMGSIDWIGDDSGPIKDQIKARLGVKSDHASGRGGQFYFKIHDHNDDEFIDIFHFDKEQTRVYSTSLKVDGSVTIEKILQLKEQQQQLILLICE